MPSCQETDRGSSTETENCLTRAITIVALTCFLVIGVTSILGRDSVPVERFEIVSPVVSNKEGKKDKLAVAVAALASALPPQTVAGLSEPLPQVFASSTAADIQAPKFAAAPVVMPPLATQKPKLASKPPLQKSYALLSDEQIAGIKKRLKLSSTQESLWPAVENALRAVARKIHATRQADPTATGAPLDPEAAEVQQLKSAAMPFLSRLRDDQKREVRMLARIIGLEAVASKI
jgi:hypothetical protein